MNLAACLHTFFDQYLPKTKGVSFNTIQAYRQTFSLFLPFAAQTLGRDLKTLELEQITIQLILDFLDYLESGRKNSSRTRGNRLAAFKSLARMIRFLYPEYQDLADRVLSIPQKRFSKKLIGFLIHEEVMQVLASINLKKSQGFRDYTIIHLLYDSGARAEETACLLLNYFDASRRTLAILGKGNRYRQIELWPKTVQLLSIYIRQYRLKPKPMHQEILFVNQRRQAFTRHGIYRLCQKYLLLTLGKDRLKDINPAHCFRHSCAINMLKAGLSLTDIKNHLGHENLQSTMEYLKLSLSQKRELQKKFIEYTKNQTKDEKLDELLDWKNEQETLNWLDSL
jgi:site-specific recombinase XerD